MMKIYITARISIYFYILIRIRTGEIVSSIYFQQATGCCSWTILMIMACRPSEVWMSIFTPCADNVGLPGWVPSLKQSIWLETCIRKFFGVPNPLLCIKNCKIVRRGWYHLKDKFSVYFDVSHCVPLLRSIKIKYKKLQKERWAACTEAAPRRSNSKSAGPTCPMIFRLPKTEELNGMFTINNFFVFWKTLLLLI